ncbi:hypothetical protein N665_1755s0005 [Sinapis alba]|nr:hypothetical protein N665_1755s0005 [Sinapis alba]
MRTNGSKQQHIAVNKVPKAQLEPVFKDFKSCFDLFSPLYELKKVPIPEEPDSEDQEELKQWKWKFKEANKENSKRHSQRCDVELKLEVARKMKDEEGFYFPHNIDFRGRAYPMHPYLHHLGSDLCRGILEFCEGKSLGKSGLRWLKIHIANLYAGGVDKFANEDRVAFTESHLEDVFDSSDRPLEGKIWWLNAEDPFQCLAACMNLSKALRSPFRQATISHIPHSPENSTFCVNVCCKDGSCNGLQHYAALGRDNTGAAAVNLFTGEKPADIYVDIAARVLKIMQCDAEEDSETFPYAKLMLDQVDRKLVKQTVMTKVHGVTYSGALNQIKKRLKERGAFADDSQNFHAACYAARVTTNVLEEMFGAARAIQIWFGKCAKVKARKQMVAFAPDFVHSLDAFHMMMTAVVCNKAGLSFAWVHDSFWTHASDVNLLESFQKSFTSLRFPPLPERGDFDLREVMRSPYFFN